MRNVELVDNSKWNPCLTNLKTNKIIIAMPHGSGIDCGWQCSETKQYFVFRNEWHAMDQNGYYCGYIPFNVYVPKKTIKEALKTGNIKLWEIKATYSKAALKAIVKGYEKDKDGNSNAPYLEDLPDIVYSAIESWQYFIQKREEGNGTNSKR